MRPIVPWFVHSLDPPLGIRLRVAAGVTPMGETQLPSPQRTLLLFPGSYGLIRQSPRPLLDFGFWPRGRSLRRWSPVPAARWTFPTLSPACFFRAVIGLPHKELGRLPANSPLETTSCGR